MAATLKLRRGTTIPSLSESEPFFHTTSDTLYIGDGSSYITLVKIGSNTGSIDLLGDITGSNLKLTGNAVINGDITLGGSIYLGDGDVADEIIINASLSGSLVPDTDNEYTLGTDSYRYQNLHSVSASIENILLPGSRILSSSLGTYQDFDTFSGSVDTRFITVNLFTSSQETKNNTLQTVTASFDGRLNNIESFSSSQETKDTTLETVTASLDSRISQLEADTGSQDSRLDNIEATTESFDGRLDNIETFTSSYYTDSSSFDSRLDYLEGDFSSSVDDRLDQLEVHSGSTDARLDNIESVSGSYATTGSNLFIGNETITGSLETSGSVRFRGIPWPAIGSEHHLFKTDGYVVEAPSGDRTYDYLGIALEQTETGSYYENSLLIYTYDNHSSPNYGTQLLVGPMKGHLRVLASGSATETLGNVSVSDLQNGTTLANVYGSEVHLGAFLGDTILIGNTGSYINVKASSILLESDITSSNTISAGYFNGDGSQITNIQHGNIQFGSSGIVSGSEQIDVNNTQNFQLTSASFDTRINFLSATSHSHSNKAALDVIDQNLSTVSDVQFNSASFTSNVDVQGNITVAGDLTVLGSATEIQTTELRITDKKITLASGSANGTEANGSGIEVDGANVSITWNNPSYRWDVIGQISASHFIGDGENLSNVTASYVHYSNVDGLPTLISGSDQVTSSLDDRYLEILGDGVISSSDQLTNVFLEIGGDNVFSSSEQVDATDVVNFDANVQDYLNSNDIHSGSYLGTATTSNLTEGSNQYYTNDKVLSYINGLEVISGSSQVTESLDGRYEDKSSATHTLLSGSDQVTESLDSRYVNESDFNNHSSSVDTRLDYLEGDFSTSVDSRLDSLETDTHTHSNKSNLDTINQDLATSDIPSFEGLSLTNLNALGSGEFNALFTGSAGAIGYRTLGNASFYNVSASVGDDPNSIPTNKAVSDALIAAGAGDITAVNDSSLYSSTTTGLIHTGNGTDVGGVYGTQGNVVIALDTGSTHFVNGVNSIVSIGDGVVSGSDQVTGSLDSRYLQILGQNVVTGAIQVVEILGSLNQYTASNDIAATTQDSRLLNLENTTASLDSTYEEKSSGTHTLVSGSSQLTSSLDSRYLEINGDGVVSGSEQVVTLLQNQDVDFGTGDIIATNITGSTLNLDNNENILIGNRVGRQLNLASSAQNIGIGASALGGNSSFSGQNADGNVAIGYNALLKVQNTGNTNVAIGYQSMYNNTIGASNTVLGSFTGTNLSNGDYNVIVGSSAGYSITTGNSNIIIGIVADVQTASDSNSIVIGSGSIGNGSNTVVIGNDDITSTELKGELTASGHFVPSQHEAFDLGSPTKRWRTLYISGSTIDLGGTLIQRDDTSGNITFLDSGSQTALSAVVGYEDITGKPTLVSQSVQIVYGDISSIPTNIVSQSSDTANIQFNITNGVVTANLKGGVVSGSGQITYGDISSLPSNIISSSADTAQVDMIINDGVISANLKGGVVSGSQQISDYNTFLEINGDGVISGSSQLTGSLVDKSSVQTITGTKTFNDIIVNGTGSFAYLQSTAGSAKIIGDSFIILNNDTPTQRYAGLAVYDSGSADVTASLQFDGQTNDWFYEYSTDGGVTTDHGVVIFGPEYNTKGSPTYLTSNTIPKSSGSHHLYDSNITDSGTLITLGSAVDVSGITNFNNTTQSTSKTTGAVIIDGGVGIAKTLNVGEDVVAYASSDRNLKDEISPIENAIEKINKIGGYSFIWNEEKQDIYKGKDYGVIAQEIEEILPELVDTRDNGYKAVKYDKIVALLIEGIKELSAEVHELKEKLK